MADIKLRDEEKGKDRRKFRRLDTQLKAQFVSKESQRGGEECAIIDFSRKGMKAKIYTSEEIYKDSEILLEVFIPGELDPINVKGIIKWVEKIENGFISGIELSKELGEIKLSKLMLFSKSDKKEDLDNQKIKITSTGHGLSSKTPKDRFIP